MFHLTRGIAFGVDVADLLELQRAFQRHRELGAAAEVKHVTGRRDQVGHRGNIVVVAQSRIQRGGRFLEMRDDLLLIVAAQPALCACKICGESGEDGELACECLGRGDADLGTRVCRQ